MVINQSLSHSQYDFINDFSRQTFMTGSYKSGKTFIGVRKCIATLFKLRQPGLAASVNYRMNKDILIPEFEAAFKQYDIQYNLAISDMTFKTEYGDIIIRTQEKRSSLEAHNLGWFYLDEVDLMPEDKALQNWRVLLSKLTLGEHPIAFGTGTNEGFQFVYKWFYQDYDSRERIYYKTESGDEYSRSIIKKNNNNIAKVLYMSQIYENEQRLPSGYVDTLKSEYNEMQVQRYLLSEFVNITTGRAYYSFSELNLVDVEFQTDRPVFHSWDVNYSDRPMCTCLYQEFLPSEVFETIPDYVDESKNILIIVKSFVNYNTNTDTQCKIIQNFYKKVGFTGVIKEYGDRVGNDRRVGAPLSHYKITESYFGEHPNYELKTRATRSIADRVHSVNNLLCSGDGMRRLFVAKGKAEDEGLLKVREDFERVVWASNGRNLDNSTKDLTDASDAASYYIYYEYDITKRKIEIDI